MFLLSAAVLGVLAHVPGAAAGKKCYAVAFSGGGDKGSFEAGVVQGLVARLPPDERSWNIMTGISAGSIVASTGALFGLGDEVAMADFMVDCIANFSRGEIYRNWFPGGTVQGVLLKSGLYNTDPLFQTLQKIFGSRPMMGRNLTIAATADATGDIVLFDESMVAGSPARWAQFVRASCAIPGIFQSVEVDGHVLSDGGEAIGVNVFSAVNRCRELVDRDEDIVLDVVTCDARYLNHFDEKTSNRTISLYLRGLQEQRYNRQMADILDACLAYPNVTFRYYVEPPKDGLPSNGLNFNRAQMEEMVKIGRSQAAQAVMGAACPTAQSQRLSRRWPKESRPASGLRTLVV